jgi:hypothetical protein
MTRRRFASAVLMAAAVLGLGGTSVGQGAASAAPSRGIGTAAVYGVDASYAPMSGDMCGHNMMIRAAKFSPRT